MRMTLLAVSCQLLAVSLSVPAQAPPRRENFLPMSVWYGGGKARAPMLEPVRADSAERWAQDLKQIRELGFNTVRTWIEWTAGEPEPGRYRFDNLKLLSRLAREAGLKLFVQVYVDSAPDWVGRRFPDSLFVTQSGLAVPSQAAPGFCFDHPGVRQAVLDFFRAAARELKGQEHFLGWDLWSEPHIVNWAIIDFVPNASFCYCPYTRARFRGWLQSRHRSLEQLNAAWYRTFESWEQVDPPRFGTILSYTDFIEWKSFIAQKLAEDLGMRAAAVREIDPRPVVTSHAAVPSLFTSPLSGAGTPDDRLMADQVDYYGTSIYPKHSIPATHWSLLMRTAAVDFTRSMNLSRGGFYIGELQGGYGVRGTVVGNPVTADDHRLWMWGILARGARAVNIYAWYPMSTGYESGGYGLVQLDGTVTERSLTAGRIAGLVTEHASLFLAAQPVAARAAILFNPLASLVGGEQGSPMRNAVRNSLMGTYRALFERSIPVDFLHVRDLEAGAASRYAILFVPYPLMLSNESARHLRRYVEEGGFLVAEARPGWNDERGHAQPIIPGLGLHEVFGAREREVRSREQIQLRLADGGSLPGAGFEQSLEPLSAATQVLARWQDQTAAVTSHAFGKGRAVLLGTFLGYALEQSADPAAGEFLRQLARQAGVVPPVRIDATPAAGSVESRVLEAAESRLWVTLNYGAESVRLRMALTLPDAVYAVSHLETGHPQTARYADGALQVDVNLPAHGVLVLRVQRNSSLEKDVP